MKSYLDEILELEFNGQFEQARPFRPVSILDEILTESGGSTTAISSKPICKYKITAPTVIPAIGFEFDISFGSSLSSPPPPPGGSNFPDYTLEGKPITTHSMKMHGFRTEGDGNRIEIATAPFDLTSAGKTTLDTTMTAVLDWVAKLLSKCNAASPDKSTKFAKAIGYPRHFTPPDGEASVKSVFPLSLYPKTQGYYSPYCKVAAAPQATLTLPLARIDEFVSIIKRSENNGWVPGLSLSGPSGARQGTRSRALYDAQAKVNASRKYHIAKKTKLSKGAIISDSNYTPTLQGFLILVVSYLRTSELAYSSRDYESFAKSYIPLNVKNPFRLLFDDLTKDEKQVFEELYYLPTGLNLWKLAKDKATEMDKNNQLFPAKVKGHQENWFSTAPTWGEFIDMTVSNKPLIRTVPGVGQMKEPVGCEVLFGPLSSIIPYQPGSRRVTVEMRRLGFDWLHSPKWLKTTQRLFDIAQHLNR